MKTKNLSFARVYAAPECRLRAIQFEQNFLGISGGSTGASTVNDLNEEDYSNIWG